jgi:hypothetical protein
MDFLLLKPDASPSRLCVAASAERGRLSMTIKTVSLSYFIKICVTSIGAILLALYINKGSEPNGCGMAGRNIKRPSKVIL